MSRVIELSDEQYLTVERVAANRGQTPAALIGDLIEDLGAHASDPRYFETEGWFRHLGATEKQIAEAKRVVAERRRTVDADP